MGLLRIFHVHFALRRRTSPTSMKLMVRILILSLLPAAALAWAPYEQQSFTQQMHERQVDYSLPTDAEHDPAMVPLAYMEGYESESSTTTDGPLDAD